MKEVRTIDPNTTIALANIVPNSPIAGFVKAASAFVGGVFGIYMILLYLRWREFYVLRRVLEGIRKDIRVIAEKKKIQLEPIREPTFISIGKAFKKLYKK